jgi:hypothetical protein
MRDAKERRHVILGRNSFICMKENGLPRRSTDAGICGAELSVTMLSGELERSEATQKFGETLGNHGARPPSGECLASP